MKQKSKNAVLVLALGLTVLSVNAQKDKNYYTQVVHLADGSEVRLLPDNINKVNVINADDWQQMTITEYLRYNNLLGVDSANVYVQKGWGSDVLNNANVKSSFWVPTNKAWIKAKQHLSPYYNSVGKVTYFDWSSGSRKEETIDYPGTDSLTVLAILEKGLTISTPASVLLHQQVLNGDVAVVDQMPIEELEPKELSTNLSSIAEVLTGEIHEVHADDVSYIWAEPIAGYAKPEVYVYLPQTLSATYNMYCVLVPESPAYDETVEVARPNRIIFTLYYSDIDGKLKTQEFLDESEENIQAFQEKFNLADNNTNRTTIRAFENDPTKIDTLFVGQFTMPVCYEGLPSMVTPVLKISSPFSVFNASLMTAFTRDIRLAAIILRPAELENKETQN